MKTRQLLILTIIVQFFTFFETNAQTLNPANGAYWGLTGNSGTNSTTNFIGTTDQSPLKFKMNNANSGLINFENTSFGYSSFYNLSTQIYGITAFGNSALTNNDSGERNSAFGSNSLSSNTSGMGNSGFGFDSMKNNLSGDYNSALGSIALYSNNSGSHNSAFGFMSLYGNETGDENSSFGAVSLEGNIGGERNCAFGSASLNDNTYGDSNVAIGYASLNHNIVGNNNTAVGSGAGWRNESGNNNLFLGNYANYPGTSTSLSNQLVVETNQNENTYPLIYGSFSENTLRFNGGVEINNISNTSDPNTPTAAHQTAGLRLLSIPNSSSSSFLTTNASGDVILQNLPVETDNSAWKLGGNSLTALKSIGTTTAFDLPFITGNATGSSEKMRLTRTTGRLGIGTNAPTTRLQITSENPNDSGLRFTNLTSAFVPPSSSTKFLTVNASGVVVLQNLPAGPSGTVSIADGINTTVTGTGVSPTPYVINATNIYTDDGRLTGNRTVLMNNNRLMFNTATDGRIYIGNTLDVNNNLNFPTSTGNYKLYVEGGILTEKVKVALRDTNNWADHVFAPDYKLKPLNEVETYIKENKHLPGISSANELMKEGLDLADMQAKQMEKIEELTLYAIEQNKQIEKQNKDIEELKAIVKTLLEKK